MMKGICRISLSFLVALCCLLSTALAQCGPSTGIKPGNHNLQVTHDGRTRDYLLHVPPQYDNTKPIALVVSWHGLGSSTSSWASGSRFSALADQRGNYIVVYPEGVSNSWNAGSCCAPATTLNIDDFGFARTLVADIQKRACIDSARIFTTGYSNGCFMSQGLICKAPDLFAASACGSGGIILETDCDKDFNKFNTSIRVFEIHGKIDPVVPYNGNRLLGFPPVLENYASNVARMECRNGPKLTYEKGRYYCEEYYNCRDGATVEQCSVDLGTHDWFTDDDFSNSEYMLDFFGL